MVLSATATTPECTVNMKVNGNPSLLHAVLWLDWWSAMKTDTLLFLELSVKMPLPAAACNIFFALSVVLELDWPNTAH